MADLQSDRLLTTAEATHLLGLDPERDRHFILDWIRRGLIPYVKLPAGDHRAWYRIPRRALLSMLGGTGELAREHRAAVARASERDNC